VHPTRATFATATRRGASAGSMATRSIASHASSARNTRPNAHSTTGVGCLPGGAISSRANSSEPSVATQCTPPVKDVGEPCEGEPHARFDAAREETSASRPVRAVSGASRRPDPIGQNTRALARERSHS
jgi:hypothetical protein